MSTEELLLLSIIVCILAALSSKPYEPELNDDLYPWRKRDEGAVDDDCE